MNQNTEHMQPFEYIDKKGIFYSIPSVKTEICRTDKGEALKDWYIDEREDGSWTVSQNDTVIGWFSDKIKAFTHFFGWAHPELIKEMNSPGDEDEVELLESLLKN